MATPAAAQRETRAHLHEEACAGAQRGQGKESRSTPMRKARRPMAKLKLRATTQPPRATPPRGRCVHWQSATLARCAAMPSAKKQRQKEARPRARV